MSAELLLKEEDVPIRECILEAIHAMRTKADRRGIELEFRDSTPSDLIFKGDRSLLNQSFKMLIESAVASSPRNSSVMLDSRIDAEGGFCLAIADVAPALPENMIRDILGTGPVVKQITPQVSVSRNTSLTISRVVAEAHEGRMLLTSTMGEGTMVRILLPQKRMSSRGKLHQQSTTVLLESITAAVAGLSPSPPALRSARSPVESANSLPRA